MGLSRLMQNRRAFHSSEMLQSYTSYIQNRLYISEIYVYIVFALQYRKSTVTFVTALKNP